MESFFAGGGWPAVAASLGGASVWAYERVVKMIKSAAVATLERTLLGTDCRMPRNAALGKKFFRLLKQLAEEKLFCSKKIRATSGHERTAGIADTGGEHQNHRRFFFAGLSHSSAHQSRLRLLSRRTLFHRLRTPFGLGLRRF